MDSGEKRELGRSGLSVTVLGIEPLPEVLRCRR
jgi:hypothetical protein